MGVELPLRVVVTILECCVTFSGVKLSIRSFVIFLISHELAGPLTYQSHSNFQQGATMFTASWAQLPLELLVCDRSISVNVITNKFVGLKCLTETKIQRFYNHVDQTRFDIVEMGCQMVQLLSAYNVHQFDLNLTTRIILIFINVSLDTTLMAQYYFLGF